jgi:hypothetical protein
MSDTDVRWLTVKNVRSLSTLQREVGWADSAKIFDELDLDEKDSDDRWRFRVVVVVAKQGDVANEAQDLADTLLSKCGYTATVHATYAEAREDLLA